MAAAIRSGSIVNRTGSMSTKTGVAPVMVMARAEKAAEGRGDHLVAPADAERAQDQHERVGAAADANRVARAHRGCKFVLEPLHFGAEHVPAARDDPLHRLLDVGGIVTGSEHGEGHATP